MTTSIVHIARQTLSTRSILLVAGLRLSCLGPTNIASGRMIANGYVLRGMADSSSSPFNQCKPIQTPQCHGMTEHPSAALLRSQLSSHPHDSSQASPLTLHILNGLAYTTGSALGSTAPSTETCLAAFLVPNKAGLTAGARAWSKHCHRSRGNDHVDCSGTLELGQEPELHLDINLNRGENKQEEEEKKEKGKERERKSAGWWGTPSGPVAVINERALELFWKVIDGASWRNLHWLPHRVLAYEVRVSEGYGMRWSLDQSQETEAEVEVEETDNSETSTSKEWVFRGFLEPQMENGHEVGWRH